MLAEGTLTVGDNMHIVGVTTEAGVMGKKMRFKTKTFFPLSNCFIYYFFFWKVESVGTIHIQHRCIHTHQRTELSPPLLICHQQREAVKETSLPRASCVLKPCTWSCRDGWLAPDRYKSVSAWVNVEHQWAQIKRTLCSEMWSCEGPQVGSVGICVAFPLIWLFLPDDLSVSCCGHGGI